MSKRSKRRKNKPQFAKDPAIGRKKGTREERAVKEEAPLMLFSFKDYRAMAPGQDYKEWQEEELLAYFLEKVGHICGVNRMEAIQNQYIKVYGDFPENSAFENPFPEADLEWGVIMRIKGQKPRAAGYLEGHIFYVVFLDGEHLFYPSKKRNT